VTSGAPIVATATRIAVQGATGVDIIDRETGLLDHVGGAATALDPLEARVAALGYDGAWTIRDI
jgi:hypothetical protein